MNIARTIDIVGMPKSPTPITKKGTRPFLEGLLPGQKIEHQGRTEYLDLVRPEHAQYHSEGETPPLYSLFFQGVHECFASHYPLALSPEVPHYLIVHEVAHTVKRIPERYRALFTRSEGKEKVVVRDDSLILGEPKSEWGRTLGLFDGALKEKVPPGIQENLVPALSTHTVESRAATMVAFMDAASPFYDYEVQTRCGIPSIRLLGTVEDYQKVLASARKLGEAFQADLGVYFQHLIPVLAKIAEQADPTTPVDRDFWSSIYKWKSHSGGAACSGWVTAFLAYLRAVDGTLHAKDPRYADWTKLNAANWGGGLPSGAFPTHVSAVPFIWDYYGTNYPMTFAGGLLGLDNEDGFLTPRLSYAVLHQEG